jgi:hypothetical protein
MGARKFGVNEKTVRNLRRFFISPEENKKIAKMTHVREPQPKFS